MKHLLRQKTRQWRISKIPTWFLRYWVWRNWRLVCSGHPHYAFYTAADIELWLRAEDRGTTVLGPVNPMGVPEWLLTNSKSYGYEEEPEEER